MWIVGTVEKKINWNEKLFSLQIKADIAPFTAGQFIKLSQVSNDKRVGRAYSLVNAPKADRIEVLAVTVEDGLLSPQLHKLEVGDSVDVSAKAAGFMTLDELPENGGTHLWFLATGTGIGPFISMLQTKDIWQKFDKVIVVYGVREQQDLAYRDLLLAIQNQYPTQVEIIFSVTREICDNALSCRIPAGLLSGEIEQKVGLQINQTDSQVMLCGNPNMISESLAILQAKGLAKNLRRSPGQITLEKYW